MVCLLFMHLRLSCISTVPTSYLALQPPASQRKAKASVPPAPLLSLPSHHSSSISATPFALAPLIVPTLSIPFSSGHGPYECTARPVFVDGLFLCLSFLASPDVKSFQSKQSFSPCSFFLFLLFSFLMPPPRKVTGYSLAASYLSSDLH